MSRSQETGGVGSGGSGRTLDATMRAPSTNAPDVVVLDSVPLDEKPKVIMNPEKDLWLSTVDGRHQSPIIPVRVGPHAETFYVHRAVLLKSEYFKRALDGDFQEAENQAVDLPEEDPAVFSFLVAFLYEGTYEPIRPVADALVVEPDKGKGKEEEEDETTSGSSESTDSDASGSDNSARSRRRREIRRRRAQAAIEERNRKEPGRHRPDCVCATCVTEVHGPPCWNCGVPRVRPPPHPRPQNWYPNGIPHPPPNHVFMGRNGAPFVRPNDRPARGSRNRVEEIVTEPRMTDEDVRTWVMAYELSVDVYICAEKFLMQDFKSCIQRCIIDEFETVGIQAAQPQILTCCKKLHAGVSNSDSLLKKVFARVGFLLARLWKNFPEETHNFWMDNPEVGGLIMRETMERRDEDAIDDLPAMDRAISRPPIMVDEIIVRDRHRGYR